MDGLCRAAGVGAVIRLAGTVYWMEPLRLGDLAGFEHYLLARRESPVDAIVSMPGFAGRPELLKSLVNRAKADMRQHKAMRMLSPEDVYGWLSRDEGMAHSAWIAIRHDRTTVEAVFTDPGEAGQLLAKLSAADRGAFVRLRDQLTGLDQYAECDWSEAPETLKKSTGKRRFMPWRRIYRHFAVEYGWSPDQVNRLTMYGLRVFMTDESDLGGPKRVAGGEARAMLKGALTAGGPSMAAPGRSAARRMMRELK